VVKEVLRWLLAQVTTKQKHGVLQPTPLNGNLVPSFEIKSTGKGSLTSLTCKKVRVLGVYKLLGLPCSFSFGVVTPLYLVHLHLLSPSLPFFMI
jgi:hypothetical protein